MPITVYWRIVEQKHGCITIEFWSRLDRKDLFKEEFIILEEERIKFRVNQKLKINNSFELQQLGKGA